MSVPRYLPSITCGPLSKNSLSCRACILTLPLGWPASMVTTCTPAAPSSTLPGSLSSVSSSARTMLLASLSHRSSTSRRSSKVTLLVIATVTVSALSPSYTAGRLSGPNVRTEVTVTDHSTSTVVVEIAVALPLPAAFTPRTWNS